MANGIATGLENILGIDTSAGTKELQQALQALQAVNVPSITQLTLPELQKYVAAGILTPSQYQAISADPTAFQDMANTADMSGSQAQKAALQQLGGIVQAGGSTPINQANLLNNINTTNQAMQAARSGIEENAQERGVAGGGQEFLSKLLNEQGNAQNANTGAVNAAANNAQLALQAMTQQGQLGGQLQSQSSADALAKAQAAQQVAEYNSQLQSTANQYNTQNANQAQQMNLQNAQNIGNQNTQNANYRTQYNAQLPGQEYNMQMQKAQGLAGAYGNIGGLKQQQAAGQNQFIGGLLGAGATLGGDYLMGQGIGASQGAKSGALNQQMTNLGNDAYPNQNPYGSGYAFGGETNPKHETVKAMQNNPTAGFNQGGMCYAEGGEVHDHEICMQIGGTVPGEAKVDGDSTENDTVHAMLSPHEIVLPRTVAQAPDAPQKAAQFVGEIKGQMPPEAGPMIGQAIQQATQPMGNGRPFSEIIKELEANGLELRLGAL